jgi:hypothetical protein
MYSSKTDSEMKWCTHKLDTRKKIFKINMFADISGQPIGSILKGQIFQEDLWKMGPILIPENAMQIAKRHRLTFQKNKYLGYTAAEAWNHASINS